MTQVDGPVKRPSRYTRNLIENALDGESACCTGESTCTGGNSGNFLYSDDIGLGGRVPLSDKRRVQAVPIGRDQSDGPVAEPVARVTVAVNVEVKRPRWAAVPVPVPFTKRDGGATTSISTAWDEP